MLVRLKACWSFVLVSRPIGVSCQPEGLLEFCVSLKAYWSFMLVKGLLEC